MDRDEQRAGCRPRGDGSPSDTGSRLWWSAVELTVVIGWLCAVVEWGWELPVLCGLTLSVLGVTVGAIAWWGSEPVDASRPIVRTAWLAGLMTVAVVGLVTVLGALGTLTVLVLAATHPRLWEWIARAVPYREGAMWEGDLSRVTDAELWQAWRRSGTRLGGASSVAVRAGVVRQREEYLDELIRRHPHVATTWFPPGSGR